MQTIGWSQFARDRHQPSSGHSYFTISEDEVIDRIQQNFDKRTPGTGDTGIDRKVLVPVEADGFFCPPRMPLQEGMPVKAQVLTRQDGEDPYIETYITLDDAKALGFTGTPAKFCEIVCYSADALMENGGKRSTDCDWEIVCILATEIEGTEPMPSLTMARNYLQKAGGTFTDYTAKEFAESIYYHSTRKGVRVVTPTKE